MTEVAQVIALHLPAARRGDRKAFAALVAATQNTVTSVALAVVRDVQHSEDIAQEAYLAVWKRLNTLRNPDSFLPWLRQITRNLARDHLRRSQARPGDQTGTEPALWDQERDQEGLGDEGAETSLLRAEEDRLIAQALEALPDESREVLTLFYREGQSSRQVARLLGLTDAAVRKRLSRARGALRSELEQKLGETLVRTVPGAAFTAVIASMLVTASPPAAAAVMLAASAKTGAKLVFGASLGLMIALVGGIAGVILGLRPVIRSSTDPEELAALERLRAWGVAIVILAVFGFLVSAWLPGWLPATIVFVLFLSAIGLQQLVILPRILEPRLAAQRRLDPAAEHRQRRQRIWCWVGMIGGGLGGLGGLIAGLIASGRISF